MRKCERPCKHGGLCDLDYGHVGLHSAGGYCTYTDEEAVTREESDRIFDEKAGPGASALLGIASMINGMLPESDNPRGIEPGDDYDPWSED